MPRASAPGTMLLVGGEVGDRAALASVFEPRYLVEEAPDGEEGVAHVAARPERYCAVLLDRRAGGVDGIAALRRLAELGVTERVPTFLIGVPEGPRGLREAYELGVMDVLEKPVVPYVVRRRVGSVVELFAARRRLSGVVEEQRDELVRRAEQVVELSHGMVEALAAAIESRDGESGGHVRRIQGITRLVLTDTELGDGLGVSELRDIALASVLHDVGKIAIPDAILTKPGRLTAEEFEVMKTHAATGARMLERIPQLRQSAMFPYAVDIARHHHERWDGSGYPDGVAGDELSVWAQAVSLADVYDALRSRRAYKPALGRDRAREMIEGGACGVFGPRLLRAFAQVEPQMSALYDVLPGGAPRR